MLHLIRPEIQRLRREYVEYGSELTVLSAAAQYGLPPGEMADLSLNVNLIGPPPAAMRAVQACLDGMHRYPDGTYLELKNCFAAAHGVGREWVSLGAGLDEVVKLLAQACIGRDDEAVIPIPTYPRYELEVQAMGGQARLIPLTPEFGLPVELLLASVTPRTKMIIICSPNNPTGVDVPRDDIMRLLQLGESGPLIVVDEALIFPLDTGMMDLVREHSNLMVLRTLSKYFGLAGLRVGYAVAHPQIITHLEVIRPTFNVSIVAEAAALAAMEDTGFLQRTRDALEAERTELLATLAGLPGVRAWPSKSSILFLDVGGTGLTSAQVTASLAARGVLVVDCKSFAGLEGSECIRVSIGSPAKNRRFASTLRQVLNHSAKTGDADRQGRRAVFGEGTAEP